jgi:NAD(P)H-hydrate epimerase
MRMIRLTRAQVREIDRRSIEEFHFPGIVLMENAARAAADVAWAMIGKQPARFVTIFCGPGNNGGDGLAIARHLHNRGLNVDIVPVFDPHELTGDALTNWNMVRAMSIELTPLSSAELTLASEPDLIIDALLGTGATGSPRGAVLQAIDLINNDANCPKLAIDIPSGLDCDTGHPLGATVRAMQTITFVAEKAGFRNPQSREYTGQIVVGDIGCPKELIEAIASASSVPSR